LTVDGCYEISRTASTTRIEVPATDSPSRRRITRLRATLGPRSKTWTVFRRRSRTPTAVLFDNSADRPPPIDLCRPTSANRPSTTVLRPPIWHVRSANGTIPSAHALPLLLSLVHL